MPNTLKSSTDPVAPRLAEMPLTSAPPAFIATSRRSEAKVNFNERPSFSAVTFKVTSTLPEGREGPATARHGASSNPVMPSA